MPNPGRDDLRAEVFNRLFSDDHSAVFSFFLGHLSDREEAKDQTQETFSRVWSRIDDLIEVAPARRRYWLFAVAKNVLIDCRRRRRVRSAALTKLQEQAREFAPKGPDTLAEERSAVRALDRAIAGLPEDRRLVLTMTVVGELTSAEIGELVGCPAGTVRSTLHDARRRLREALDAESAS
jgi:RNA polymerase sigma-70 factor (ECF subfamily)